MVTEPAAALAEKRTEEAVTIATGPPLDSGGYPGEEGNDFRRAADGFGTRADGGRVQRRCVPRASCGVL